jgi:hypothetical protein
VYQGTIDAAGFAVWARIQGGEPLTLALCREVVAELGSTARPNAVYFQCRQWDSGITQTRQLGRR